MRKSWGSPMKIKEKINATFVLHFYDSLTLQPYALKCRRLSWVPAQSFMKTPRNETANAVQKKSSVYLFRVRLLF